MDSIIVRHRMKNYAFYPDRIEIIKKDNIKRTIKYDEIKRIVYNPKLESKDVLSIFFSTSSDANYYSKDSFAIKLNKGGFSGDMIYIKISNDDFEKIRNIIPIPIDVI